MTRIFIADPRSGCLTRVKFSPSELDEKENAHVGYMR